MAFTDWLSVADAAVFFDTRFGAEAWATLKETVQVRLLTTAYNRIYNDPALTIPATPSAAVKAKLAYCLALTAWYMYSHLEDEDRRKGLQAQGVVAAGLVKETYAADALDNIPLPAEAIGVLESLFTTKKSFYVADIDRKEPVGGDQDVTEVDNSLNTSGVY